MNCLACDGKLSKYLNDSCLNLPVFHCVNCNLFVTGNNYEEIEKKIFSLYKEEYWDERGAEKSIKSDYTDKDSEGKRRNWVSQFAYCKPYLKNKKKILEIGVGAGQAAFWFDQMGFQITGIEPDGRNVALINKKLKNGYCMEGNIEDFNINDKFEV